VSADGRGDHLAGLPLHQDACLDWTVNPQPEAGRRVTVRGVTLVRTLLGVGHGADPLAVLIEHRLGIESAVGDKPPVYYGFQRLPRVLVVVTVARSTWSDAWL